MTPGADPSATVLQLVHRRDRLSLPSDVTILDTGK